MRAYDFVVIGGGSAGYAAAGTAARLGLKTAVIEGGERVGGLCILRGCMPSKTLIESANRFETIRRAREFGLRAGDVAVCGNEIIERKKRLVAEFADYRQKQLETGAFDFIRGWASFVDSHTLEIRETRAQPANQGAERVSAKSFLVATGSALKHLDIPGLCETSFLDSDAVLESTHIPRSVIVLGAGATGLEFAHFYAGLGCEVTIVQRGAQVLSDMDGDVATALSDAFERRGIRFFFRTKLTRIEKCGAGKCVRFQHDGEEKSVEAEEIIYALGRAPQLAGLALENAGVAAQHGHLSVNAFQQTNAPHIFAAGDASGPYEIVHIAIQQGEVAARNAARFLRGEKNDALHEPGESHAAHEPLEQIDYRLKLFVVFSEPQVAAVGFTERDLMEARADYAIARYPFADHGKAIVHGETDGFVKLIARRPGCEILGAAAVGPNAGELIHEIVVAMHFRASAHDLLSIPHYHPTLSEIWTYPAEELALS